MSDARKDRPISTTPTNSVADRARLREAARVAEIAYRSRGKTTATRTVWCGSIAQNDPGTGLAYYCGASHTARPQASERLAEAEWMGLGWCRFDGIWHCPECSAKYVPMGLRRGQEGVKG
jgi:hypothetical protein